MSRITFYYQTPVRIEVKFMPDILLGKFGVVEIGQRYGITLNVIPM